MIGTIMFNNQFARDFGMNEAILFQNILYWCEFNKANNKNFYEGTYWTYNSVAAFSKLFLFMTPKQVRSGLEKLKKEGLIDSKQLNKKSYDHTKWYSVTKKGRNELARCLDEAKKSFTDEANQSATQGDTNCPQGQISLPARAEQYHDITHNKPNLNSSDNNALESFTDVQDSKDAGACTAAETQTPPSKADCHSLPRTEDSPDNENSSDITSLATDTPDDIRNFDMSRSFDSSSPHAETQEISRKQEKTTSSVSDPESPENRQAVSGGASPCVSRSLETYSAAGGEFPFAEEKKAGKASPKRKSARKTLTNEELDGYFASLGPETVRRMHEITETLYKKARIADPLYVRSGNYLRNQTKKLTDFMASSGRTADELEETFNFAFTDSFWCNVVVSVDVFLRNYTKILRKMKDKEKTPDTHKYAGGFENSHITRKDYEEDW